MDLLRNGYNGICDFFIRPPRSQYTLEHLGPKTFLLGNRLFQREDIELLTARRFTIQCSHYTPFQFSGKLPCVIYIHGNSGCRLDSFDCIPLLLPNNITLLSFDCAGSGLSEGEFVSLGYYERDDISTIVDYLRRSNKTSRIALWGRSMGAVTALLYCAKYLPTAHKVDTTVGEGSPIYKPEDQPSYEMQLGPQVVGLVLDSPFASLCQLVQEFVQTAKLKIPSMMVSLALKVISRTIIKKASFDIECLNPIAITDRIRIPALFVHTTGDSFILPHHSIMLYDSYAGEKDLLLFSGSHNSVRPSSFFNAAAFFFYRNLQLNFEENDCVIPFPRLVYASKPDASFFVCKRGVFFSRHDRYEDSYETDILSDSSVDEASVNSSNGQSTILEEQEEEEEEENEDDTDFYDNICIVVVKISKAGITVQRPYSQEEIQHYEMKYINTWNQREESFIVKYSPRNGPKQYLIFTTSRSDLLHKAMDKYVSERADEALDPSAREQRKQAKRRESRKKQKETQLHIFERKLQDEEILVASRTDHPYYVSHKALGTSPGTSTFVKDEAKAPQLEDDDTTFVDIEGNWV